MNKMNDSWENLEMIDVKVVEMKSVNSKVKLSPDNNSIPKDVQSNNNLGFIDENEVEQLSKDSIDSNSIEPEQKYKSLITNNSTNNDQSQLVDNNENEETSIEESNTSETLVEVPETINETEEIDEVPEIVTSNTQETQNSTLDENQESINDDIVLESSDNNNQNQTVEMTESNNETVEMTESNNETVEMTESNNETVKNKFTTYFWNSCYSVKNLLFNFKNTISENVSSLKDKVYNYRKEANYMNIAYSLVCGTFVGLYVWLVYDSYNKIYSINNRCSTIDNRCSMIDNRCSSFDDRLTSIELFYRHCCKYVSYRF
jgi:hypothetical protein